MDPKNTYSPMLRAVIIEELNFLNWEKKIPGFPEKHAGIIIRSERRHECCSQVLIYLVPGPGITSSYSYMRILVSGADDVVRGTAVYQVPGIYIQRHSRWIFAAEYIPYVQDAVQGTGTTADYSTSCRATCEASKQQNTEIRPDERRSKPAAVAR